MGLMVRTKKKTELESTINHIEMGMKMRGGKRNNVPAFCFQMNDVGESQD